MAIIVCPECGKEISDQHEYCIYCGYPINPKEEIKEKDVKVEAYDVMILNYNSKKQDAKEDLMKICSVDQTLANVVISNLPCYIFEDVSLEYAEKIGAKLAQANFAVAIYNEVGSVKYLSNDSYSKNPLPILVPSPRKKRIITFYHATFKPRPIVMPSVTPKYNEGFKNLNKKSKKKVTTKKAVKKKKK